MTTTARARTGIDPTSATDDRLLLRAATFFTFAVLVHGADHARRGVDSVDADVFVAGTAAMALEIGVVLLIAARHRLAPLAAVAAGFSLAAGYVVVHFLPERSWLSDSLSSAAEVSALSWAAASLEVVAALTLGVAGLVVLRRRGGLASATRPSPGEQPLRRAFVHPVTLAMTVGNAALLAVSALDVARG